jgi:hypothetical protein
MGAAHTKGLGYLADANDAAALAAAYREARVAVQHAAAIEKAVVKSASVLYTDVDAGKKKTVVFEPLIDKRAAALLDEASAAYRLQASQRSAIVPALPGGEPPLSAEEKEAASLVVEQVPPAAGAAGAAGGRGAGGGAGGGGRGRGAGGPSLPTEFNSEFSALLSRHLTVLEIRDFLSGEFTPLPLKDVMAVLKARETAGSIKLVPKAVPAAAVAGKKK